MMKDTAPLSVVIVDDNIVNLMVIEHYLNRLFVNHVSFTDPHKALTYLQTNACDIVITDYSMPGMDGFELIKAIKKIPTCKAYLILSTANITDQAFVLKGLHLGVDSYLPKPVDFSELGFIIESLKAQVR
jgi:CheY-like chemotaxis protein